MGCSCGMCAQGDACEEGLGAGKASPPGQAAAPGQEGQLPGCRSWCRGGPGFTPEHPAVLAPCWPSLDTVMRLCEVLGRP